MELIDDNERLIGFEALYVSMLKCKKNVGWKDSVAVYYLHGIENTLKLEQQLKNGTYKARPPKKFTLTHPKKREAVSISFRDRIYQRSLNDNEIYPTMTADFIDENCACQKGKGTDYARNLLDSHLTKFYREHGRNGYILQCDIHHFYQSIKHSVADGMFRNKLSEPVYSRAKKVLNEQYDGDVGYNPGSQMIQLDSQNGQIL